MSDLISREELKKTIKRMESLPWGDEKGNRVEFVWTSELVEHLIDKAPSAEKKGKWKPIDVYEVVVACSECNHKFTFQHNYCPHCGAKMEVTE